MADTLTTLISSGPDAFNNLWDVVITPPTNGGVLPTSYSIRIDGFDPVEPKIKTYPKSYKGVTITVPGSDIDLDRSFTMTFRGDSVYKLYGELQKWKVLTFSGYGEGQVNYGSSLGGPGNNSAEGTIEVMAYKSDATNPLTTLGENPATASAGVTWVYKNVVCVETGEPKYVRGDGQPVSFTARFIFGKVDKTVTN